MGFVSKQSEPESVTTDITDGAIDTLSRLIRVIGDESFLLDRDSDPALFPNICGNFARHVENGAAVPEFDIVPKSSGAREWDVVQRFLVDRRRHEKKFVTERLGNYREIVNDLVSEFREIGRSDRRVETNIRDCLESLDEVIEQDELPKVKVALTETIGRVHEIFSAQRTHYETQLKGLNDRMSDLRQDLVAVREEMKRDSLTQSFNRGAFDMALRQSVNMHFFSAQPVCLLMVDLDEFKAVNDNYGHSVGDAVLIAVGECLARSFIRKTDLVARFGGDEFAVILPDTKADQVPRLVERFLALVRAISIDAGDTTVGVTCSVGFSEVKEEDTPETFVIRADKALFEAKANGRDQATQC